MRAVCVCIPARNEAEHLPVLLEALAQQTIASPVRVALCVNNSDDDTAIIALGWAAGSAGRLDLHVIERCFEPRLAHAGSARKAAMDLGAELLGEEDGVLLSSDADCRPPPQWIAAVLAASADRQAIVGGRLVLDELDPLDAATAALDRRFQAYWTRVRAIEDAVAPCAWDLPPRHGDHTGASLALGVGLYRRARGVPPIPCREDLALVDAAIAAGGRLVHPDSVWTRVSGRMEGRAEGGMAVHMADLAACAAERRTPKVPNFVHWRARAEWRRLERERLSEAEVREAERALAPMPHDMALPELGS